MRKAGNVFERFSVTLRLLIAAQAILLVLFASLGSVAASMPSEPGVGFACAHGASLAGKEEPAAPTRHRHDSHCCLSGSPLEAATLKDCVVSKIRLDPEAVKTADLSWFLPVATAGPRRLPQSPRAPPAG